MARVTIDVTTLSGWNALSDGPHSITVKAKAQGYRDSLPTTPVTITKQASGPTPRANLAAYSWAELKQLSDMLVAGSITGQELGTTYHINVGDTKNATINSETHPFRLVDTLHDVDANGNSLGFTFEQVDLMADYYSMKSSMSDTDNWRNSDLITTINNFTVETELNNVITPAAKQCCNSVTQSGTYTHASKLWIMSETEIANTQNSTYGNTVEGTPYKYYTDLGYTAASRIKEDDFYWLRSPYSALPYPRGFNSIFAFVRDRGDVDWIVANSVGRAALCFCI